MKVLDLFAGLGSATAAFVERGHEVVTTDIHDAFHCDIVGDILDDSVVGEVVARGPYDFIWASPPCQGFTVMNIGRNWTPPPDNQPKTDTARMGLKLVEQAILIIARAGLGPFIIENPRAKLRKLPVMEGLERRTITMCQYGMTYMKPTDLWGGFPSGLQLHPACKNGDPCHTRAPRGSRTGAQGTLKSMQTYKEGTPEFTAAYRRMPAALSLDICLAMEAHLEGRPLEDDRLF